MRIKPLCLLLALASQAALGQGTVPTFTHTVGESTFNLAGRDPGQGGTTNIPTVLVPIALSFESKKVSGKPFVIDAAPDHARILASPVFSRIAFGPAGTTQYADALLRTTFPKSQDWHTLLAKPEVKPVKITIPVGSGYVLTSKKEGGAVAIVDIEFLQKELFKQLPKQDGKLIIAITPNTTFYAMGDATVCCSWGTHGVDRATGNSFVLASYLSKAPSVITDRDVQPLTQQLAQFLKDPLFEPLYQHELYEKHLPPASAPGNAVSWMRPDSMQPGDGGRCGGIRVASTYFQLEPTDTNPKNNFPASKPFVATAAGATYHVQNVALLPWYIGAAEPLGSMLSFPDAKLLTEVAKPCPERRPGGAGFPAPPKPAVEPVPLKGGDNGHRLIG